MDWVEACILADIVHLDDHYLADWMIDPVRNHEPFYQDVTNFSRIGIRDAVVRFDKRVPSKLLTNCKELLLPAFW